MKTILSLILALGVTTSFTVSEAAAIIGINDCKSPSFRQATAQENKEIVDISTQLRVMRENLLSNLIKLSEERIVTLGCQNIKSLKGETIHSCIMEAKRLKEAKSNKVTVKTSKSLSDNLYKQLVSRRDHILLIESVIGEGTEAVDHDKEFMFVVDEFRNALIALMDAQVLNRNKRKVCK